ncbi:amino acid ABC transporter permease [Ligilactobacillus agilis]|jgi:aspartate/glutamate/glutamine transport system permease protein|uniref:Glutamine transport system permease n=2 Tax=Ligilactobacillus agilis TaxID=1601 RepID=A0A0R2AAR5_9LACO|nr:amino acid ABC transporter permease [Ligilactobacillus agilis]ASR41798.1 glutamine ABC transporter permease [Ligilactobacillus agilis]KRM64545.1 glutamine transport system permease [Ligilactobacillus agilis DSM 20509]MBM6763235.1 amino acid ABC transporter permease [Ligilactobacillus agilis]MBM6773704.1 amino acid ABC transporter permease [Ligilactobacillus agilis]MCI5762461.1 amino acid ABC transporter permease [Ligilactobacillus agilis]
MITLFLDNWQTYLTGFGNTILASIIALVFSLIIGSAFAIMELLPSRLLRVIAHIYIEVFRNIPLLVVAMFFYIVVPQYVVKLDGFTAGTIGLTLYTSSFIAETVRAGILAVDPGQMEGARANGLTYWQAMRYIVLPQAYKIVIPPLGNQFINLIKNSSVLAFLAGFDLMYQAQTVASATFKTFSAYFIVGFFYLVLTLPLSYYMRYLEKKLA